MTDYVFEPLPVPTVPTTDGQAFPVRRIFLIGKNYADHVREMGDDPAKTPPVFFTKPADAVIVPTPDAPAVPYARGTEDYHYEGELVLALKAGGTDIPADAAMTLVYGLALGCDMTRRDLQAAARKKGLPWDMAKGFDQSAVMAPIVPGAELSGDTVLSATVNGEIRQSATLGAMIWSPAEIIAQLSALVELKAGDLIYTGTPEGVGPLHPGDRVEIAAGDLPALRFAVE